MRFNKKNVLFIAFITLILYLFRNNFGLFVGGSGRLGDFNSKEVNEADVYFPTEDWRTSTPEEQGMDSGKLADMLHSIKDFSGIRSVLVIRHGYLVLESYRAPYDRDTAMNVKSVSKSFMSALTGIAIREKYINNVDQKVAEFLPEYFENADPRKKEITLKHLLTMTSGLPTIEPDPKLFSWARSDDWVKHIIDLPMSANPGDKFEYSTGLTHIMSAIITKTSGLSTMEFAKKHLFEPTGIELERWTKDSKGIYLGGCEMYMTPRDMAKFGYLYLNKGMWNGKEIIPKKWIESSMKNQVRETRLGDRVTEYGYWWWLGKDYYMAQGWGGQYIIVNPRLDIVVVFTSIDLTGPHELFNSHIRRAVRSETAIKPNPSASERLQANIERLASSEANYITPSPEIIYKTNGKTFKCEDNPWGIDSFSLTFSGSECTFTYNQVNPEGREYPSEYPVGLNGKYVITPTECHETYFGVDTEFYPVKASKENPYGNVRTYFPINEPGGIDKYTVAFEGHWQDDNTFILRGMWPMGDPLSFRTVIRFEGNEADVSLGVTPIGIQSSIKGVMQ